MTFLRTASTRRLLGVIAGIVAAIAATAAIAVAAAGSGPVPKAQPLASAIHQALGARTVQGVNARITFTNHLIDASALQGTDPILSGAAGRLWLSDRHQLRLELQSANGDAEVLVSKGRFWLSDPASHTVYEGTVPKGLMGGSAQAGSGKAAAKDHGIPSIAEISKTLAKVMQHVNLSGATPSNQAGQPAYTVAVSPKHDAGLLGSLQLAWDAARGVPLRFAIYARGNPSPVIELRADDITYGAVPASDFNIAPPAGSQIVKVATGQTAATRTVKNHRAKHHMEVSGVKQVAAKLPFTLTAPKTLVGLPRHTVTLLDWGGSPAALVTYGQGLGGIAVIEKAAKSASSSAGSSSSSSSTDAGSGPGGNVSLPTVSINGATGHELDTALGTLVTFSRGGVGYTVIGSVPSAAADAAARGL